MNNTFLIFPCFLTDKHYYLLQQIKDNLTDLCFDLNEISVCQPKLIGIDLHKAILNLKELISYRNLKGYKWNSYILSIIIIKLNYISEVIKGEMIVKDYVLAEACDNYIFLIQKILESSKKELEVH